ncbi:MAG TPA: ABC transporter permease, partial [Micromonosporaceae bacterium]
MTVLWVAGKRLLAALGTLGAVSLLLFAGSEVLPGDAASASLGSATSLEEIAERRRDLGLDEPMLTRYVEWATAALRGDLGHSLVTGR